MPGGRPAKPMTPAEDECLDGAMSFEAAAQFLGVSVRMVEVIARERGELEIVYEGRKPRLLRRQLVARLAAQLEASRAERERGAGART